MILELSDLDFTTPSFVVHHYYLTGTIAILLNLFVFYLIIFQNKKMDTFRYYMFCFQLACSFVDLHISFAMQPIPLFPLKAGHFTGILATQFSVSPHILMTFLSIFVGFQVNILNLCFLRKHQAISRIDQKHVLSEPVYSLLVAFFLCYTATYTICFYLTGISKEEQFRIINEDYPMFREQFEQLDNFVLYEVGFEMLGFFFFIVVGCLQSTATVSFFVFQMYNTLVSCRNNLSRSTLEKHRTALRSLVAQFLTTPIGILPAMLIVLACNLPFKGVQRFTWYMFMSMTTHSTINSLVVIFTVPEFRCFVMFWSEEARIRRRRSTVQILHNVSGNTQSRIY